MSTDHHDYTQRAWGHDCAFYPTDREGRTGRAIGWGRGIEPGHYLILRNGEGTTRYRVDLIQYMADPPDQWSARVSFAPRAK